MACALVVISFRSAWASPFQQTSPTAQEKATQLMQELTPEEKVGQLFLITMQGTGVDEGSNIFDLVSNHHIGGVVLLASHGNFAGEGSVLNQTLNINRKLQMDRWAASQRIMTNPVGGESFTPSFIPLFIAIPQEGDGYPYDQILSGLTPLPNEMAIGATWKPELATQVGSVLGQELSSLGFNMLIGPSLDILETPHVEGLNDLGTRTFGGDPYWVSEMASAYITGVHQGSQGKMVVVAKHFPGQGGADRLPEEEVSTVRKSLEQLKSFELNPFFTVTGDATSLESTTDALLTSHIRYQGFQGNIRATTRPVSLDPQAFNSLMELAPIAAWRNNGGVMISDNLGSQAIRRFYDLNSQVFDPRRVTLNAFLAGNDLLYVADFSVPDSSDPYTETLRTLAFFAQKYREDPAFAQRVDASVLRILSLKFKLYPEFSHGSVIPNANQLDQIGQGNQVVFEVARDAATLISPSQAELDDQAPDPPDQNDRIVFISDTRQVQACQECDTITPLMRDAIEEAVLRRYGPTTGGQVSARNLSSYSLSDLQELLDGVNEELPILSDLKQAHWVVFAMLNASNSYPSYQTLSQFLAERPDLFLQKRVVVFAFNAPYYLDATNITKLTAYYSLYSKTPQFLDLASYLLFGEIRSVGSVPVTVPGVYDLNRALFPDPEQIISLMLDLPEPEASADGITPEPLPLPEYRVGEVISLRTGIIADNNGHRVPDGTPVSFIFSQGGLETQVVETTVDGIARTTYNVVNYGPLEIRAESEPAKQSTQLRFDVPIQNGEVIPETPTIQPTSTPEPSLTPTETPAPVETIPVPSTSRPDLGDWFIALLIASGIAWSFYRLAALVGQVRWGVRGGFLAFIGGLATYSYMAMKLPGSEILLIGSISRGVFFSTLIGAILGLLLAWGWRQLKTGKKSTI
jgi:beta-N-acetylhexosaminidase